MKNDYIKKEQLKRLIKSCFFNTYYEGRKAQKMKLKTTQIINQINRHYALKDSKAFTQTQLNKLIELVACSYMYNEDYHIGTPQEQKLLKNIYYILTGSDNPNNER